MKGSTLFKNGRLRKAFVRIGAALVSLAVFSGGGKTGGILPAGFGTGCEAEAAVIASDASFSDLNWSNLLIEADAFTGNSVAQSVCATKYYIIVMENAAEDPHQPDRVTAYYRLPYDEKGKTVRPFSRAKSVQDTDWEHCNGMAYNPRTDRVYVSLYTNHQGGDAGDIFVMNPYTLGYEDKIHVSDDYNILGIGYDSVKDRYIIQTDVKGGYSIKILDSNFQVIDNIGSFDPSPGSNFNDLCVTGDYVLNNPVTAGQNIGEYLNVYSLSRRTLVGTFPENYGITDADTNRLETESICELGQGEFLALVNLTTFEGQRKYRLYWTTVPTDFRITVLTNGEGSAGGTTNLVARGEAFDLLYDAQKGYQLSAIVINGKIVNIDGQDKKKGTFRVENIQTDQTIDVRFAPAIVTQTPKPTPTPEPETGEEAVVTSSSDKAEVAAGVAAGLSNQGPGGKGGEEAADKKTEDGKNGFNLPAFLQSVLERILENAVWSPVIGVTAAAMLIALIVLLVTGTRIRMARKAQHERFMKKRREDEAMLMRQLEEDRRFAGRLENMSFEELKDLR